MLTRLSRALLRVFPAILLVVVGLLTALFRKRRGPRRGAAPVPVPARQTVPSPRRRGAAVALLALLLGLSVTFALLGDDGVLGRFLAPLPRADREAGPAVAVFSPAIGDRTTGNTPDVAAPGASAGRGGAAPFEASNNGIPTFDTVRVEPNGELVVAGRAPPGSAVELLVDGTSTATVVADANGQFAIVPPALAIGNSEVGLRVTDTDGSVRRSRESVAVVVSSSREAKPLVALTSPDRSTVVLSQPGSQSMASRAVPQAAPGRMTADSRALSSSRVAGNETDRPSRPGNGGPTGTGSSDEALPETSPNRTRSGTPIAPGASPVRGGVSEGGDGSTTKSEATSKSEVGISNSRDEPSKSDGASSKIVSVDAREGGRLFVSGRAAAGSTVRLYLNDTLIAPATVGRDGTVRFTIGSGVQPGAYKVRLDEVDPASGKVRSRVEVPFSMPDTARMAAADRPATEGPGAPANGREPARALQPMAASPGTAPRQGEVSGTPGGLQDSPSGTPTVEALPGAGRGPSGLDPAPAAVFVPEVKTARIERGDNLWNISLRTYGEGDRYTAIYDANQDQIRDPDLIYPGQVFVLPSPTGIEAVRDDKRDATEPR